MDKTLLLLAKSPVTLQESLKLKIEDFPSGPAVKNPPANAGDTGLNPGPGTRALLATEQQSPCATITEPELQSSGTMTTELSCCNY